MKKAVIALVLLGLLAGVSLYNIRYLDRFTSRMEAQVQRSRACWVLGDTSGAIRELSLALADWYGSESYTHVFIRHSEVNDVTDAFYDVFAALSGEDAASAGSQYDRLIAHLDSIDTMEHITVKSVF